MGDIMRYGAVASGTTVTVICHRGVIDAVADYVYNIGAYRRGEILVHNTNVVHWEYCPASQCKIWLLHAHGLVHHLFGVEGQ